MTTSTAPTHPCSCKGCICKVEAVDADGYCSSCIRNGWNTPDFFGKFTPVLSADDRLLADALGCETCGKDVTPGTWTCPNH